MALPREFLSKIVITKDNHWFWIGCKNKSGYGQFRPKGKKLDYVHRYAWKKLKGPIPKNKYILHKNSCHLSSCCNPDRLYPGTSKDNAKDVNELGHYQSQKTHCPKGHEYSDKNTRRGTRGTGNKFRICKTCERVREKQNRHKNI